MDGGGSDSDRLPPKQETILRYFVSLYAAHKGALAIFFVLILLKTLIDCSQPLLVRSIIDGVTGHNGQRHLVTETAFLIGAIAVSFGLSAWATFVVAGVERDVRTEMLFRSYARIFANRRIQSTTHTGKIISHLLTDIDRLSVFLPTGVGGLFQNFVLVVSVIAFMTYLDFRLSCVVVLALPLLLFIFFRLGRRMYRHWIPVRDKYDEMARLFHDELQGLSVAQSYGAETYKLKATRDVIWGFEDSGRRLRLDVIYNQAVFCAITMLSATLIWAGGGTLVVHRSITVGGLVSFASYVAMLAGPINFIMGSNAAIVSAVIAFSRMKAIGSDGSEGLAQVQRSSQLASIETIAVTIPYFGYSDDKLLLKDVECDFRKGRIYVITGANGTGKSTLLKILGGFESAKQGVVSYNGHDSRSYDLADIRKAIAYVQQEPFLYNSTIRDNLLLGRTGIPEHSLIDVCRKVGVWDIVSGNPLGLDFKVSENGRNLSGGQRQKIHLARALLGNPSVVLMDEFTSAMDSSSENHLVSDLKEIFAGRITIMVTHSRDLAGQADEELRIESDGSIVKMISSVAIPRARMQSEEN